MVNDKFFSCESHIEYVIEDYLDLNFKAPDIQINSSSKCSFCGDQSVYLIF